ncbi:MULTISPECIES: hypothetical protein [Acetobacteraceae]|uniref:Uncharacterized protein n=1 Tax=Parasaccharibacter apium TaxID=1510841 RepID=A0A7U7G7R8_9PROT|nr:MULTISPECIES: hypothetical protein [Acetobacteraceae]CDG34440.1 hypothetical protein SACS_1702 [Parasaccharibacter apium]
MRWIDWKASSQRIAGRMLLLALLGGLILGGAVGGWLVWALGHP